MSETETTTLDQMTKKDLLLAIEGMDCRIDALSDKRRIYHATGRSQYVQDHIETKLIEVERVRTIFVHAIRARRLAVRDG